MARWCPIPADHRPEWPRRSGWLALCLGLALLTGCADNMRSQPRYAPYDPSSFFADGASARPLPSNVVVHGQPRTDELRYTGKVDGTPAAVFPFPVTLDVLTRGQEEFNIYCAVCHGRAGDGNGIVPQRGFSKPPSYHTDRLRNAPAGHFFDVITNGFGAMPSYADRIAPADRWAIVAYIRALQLSQHATLDDVPPDQRSQLEGAR